MLGNDGSDATSESDLKRCNFISVTSDLGKKVAHLLHTTCSVALVSVFPLPRYLISI